MLRRIFNVLITLCGIWIAILIWNWWSLIPVLSPQIVLALMAVPLAFVLTLYYISGI